MHFVLHGENSRMHTQIWILWIQKGHLVVQIIIGHKSFKRQIVCRFKRLEENIKLCW